MAKPKIKLSMQEKTVPQRITFGRTIATGILQSALTDKTALAARITDATDALEIAQGDLDLTLRAVPAKSAVRDSADAGYQNEFDAVATLVETQTGFNASVMADMGFEIASQSRAIITMTKVMNLHLSIGDEPGEVHWTCDPVKGARSYLVEYLLAPQLAPDTADWKSATPGSKSNGDIKNLASGQRAWVRARALGAGEDNLGAWSDPISITVP